MEIIMKKSSPPCNKNDNFYNKVKNLIYKIRLSLRAGTQPEIGFVEEKGKKEKT